MFVMSKKFFELDPLLNVIKSNLMSVDHFGSGVVLC